MSIFIIHFNHACVEIDCLSLHRHSPCMDDEYNTDAEVDNELKNNLDSTVSIHHG